MPIWRFVILSLQVNINHFVQDMKKHASRKDSIMLRIIALIIFSQLLVVFGAQSAHSNTVSAYAFTELIPYNFDWYSLNGNSSDNSYPVQFSGVTELSVGVWDVGTDFNLSSSRSGVFSVTNISTDKFVTFSVFFNSFLESIVDIQPTKSGIYTYSSRATGYGTSLAIAGSFLCDPNILQSNGSNCDGVHDFRYYQFGGPDYFSLAPNQTQNFQFTLDVSIASSFQPLTPVPLPASGWLLFATTMLLGSSSVMFGSRKLRA